MKKTNKYGAVHLYFTIETVAKINGTIALGLGLLGLYITDVYIKLYFVFLQSTAQTNKQHNAIQETQRKRVNVKKN